MPEPEPIVTEDDGGLWVDLQDGKRVRWIGPRARAAIAQYERLAAIALFVKGGDRG